ncbi:MAG: hypothetical protein V1674_07090 [Candidatus Omnitrophota bacterium]
MNKKGFVLISSYMIVSVLLIIGVSFVVRSIAEKRAAERAFLNTAALYMAESGVECTWNYLRGLTNPPTNANNEVVTACSNQDLCNGSCSGPSGCTSLCGKYSTTITSILRSGQRPSIRIIATGTVSSGSNTVTRQLVDEIRLDDYARYAYFTNTEEYFNNKVWFISNDSLNGPTQTNGQLHISGDPTFNDSLSGYEYAVRMSYSSIDYMHGGPPTDNPNFITGIQMGAEKEELPSKALELRGAVGPGELGLKLNGSTTIILNSNGTMNVTNSQNGWNNYNTSLPLNGAVFVYGGDVMVSGVLDGQLTIGTNRNIIVTDNITYLDKTGTDPDFADVLGLIAEKDVKIGSSAPTNVEVDASIMALSKSFMVEDYDGPNKGTLTVYGGIIQRDRGPVGTFDPVHNVKASGYSKDYQYDSRLAGALTPPFYPKTNDYLNLSWQDEQYALPASNASDETPPPLE